MKYRLFLAVVVFVLVPFLIVFRVSGTPTAPAPPPTPAVETSSSTSLRSLAQKRGFSIGAGVELAPLQNDPNYGSVLAREFNLLVPENAFKFDDLHPKRDRYDFRKLDRFFAFAKANNMLVRGSPLVWHYALPSWLNEGNFTRDELLAIMREHIQTLVSRYRGQVFAWDVVNEALNRDGSLKDTIWLRQIGPEYIDLAYRWTHEADPQARLFYSDYQNEELGRKADAMYTMVKGLLQRGVPIHGVGFQSHRGLKNPPDLESHAKNIKRFGELGVEVQFTELDIKIAEGTGSKEERLAAQARTYGDLLQVCLRAQNCSAFITWGFTDRYTWISGTTGELDAPLIFDKSYQPKPAYNTIKEVLNSGV